MTVKRPMGTSLVVQWVGFPTPNAGFAEVLPLAGEQDPTCPPHLRGLHATVGGGVSGPWLRPSAAKISR